MDSGVLNWFMDKGLLISPETADLLDDSIISQLREQVLNSPETIPLVIDENFINSLKPRAAGFNVEIVKSFQEPSEKRDMRDFVGHYNARYNTLRQMLSDRPGLQNIVSIGRLKNKTDRENISVIGMIRDIGYTKNNNIIIQLEDPTGTVPLIITKNNKEVFDLATTLTLDEVIGVSGMSGKNVLFCSDIIWPDIPMFELRKSPLDESAIVLSDLHVGSNMYLGKEFDRFLSWIRGDVGSDKQKETAKKVKYIFIIGDLVDGVGIYPGQYEELTIKDIYKQYEECARLISKIPKDKVIIICPGNHDALRLAEPQPPLSKKLAKPLYEIPNVIMVSNPAIVNIGKTKEFSGFNVLMYHGYSFDYYVANIESIRNAGGYNRPDLIMKYLLKRRHLAPTNGSTLYVPQKGSDPLVINTIPDFFFTGHIHKSVITNFKNITLVCGSCWQGKTSFQEKVGHEPEPCRVPLINLRTRKMRVLKFGG